MQEEIFTEDEMEQMNQDGQELVARIHQSGYIH